MSEGVADFVRSELGGPTGWDDYHCRGTETYLDGYGCAATLLRFAEAGTPGTVRALHARLRTQSFDGLIAGRDVAALWAQCALGACAPR